MLFRSAVVSLLFLSSASAQTEFPVDPVGGYEVGSPPWICPAGNSVKECSELFIAECTENGGTNAGCTTGLCRKPPGCDTGNECECGVRRCFDFPDAPTTSPTRQPVTSGPTGRPTTSPTLSPLAPTDSPTGTPTKSPLASTDVPTLSPLAPTDSPTLSPLAPTDSPTKSPTKSPTESPTESPTLRPSNIPSKKPSMKPTYPINIPYTSCPPGLTPGGIGGLNNPGDGSGEWDGVMDKSYTYTIPGTAVPDCPATVHGYSYRCVSNQVKCEEGTFNETYSSELWVNRNSNQFLNEIGSSARFRCLPENCDPYDGASSGLTLWVNVTRAQNDVYKVRLENTNYKISQVAVRSTTKATVIEFPLCDAKPKGVCDTPDEAAGSTLVAGRQSFMVSTTMEADFTFEPLSRMNICVTHNCAICPTASACTVAKCEFPYSAYTPGGGTPEDP